MKANIFEIKCSITNPKEKHQQLLALDAEFKGSDHQIDTYFDVAEGRLKLREGNIENTLIRYHRQETQSIKQSNVIFQPLGSEIVSGLKAILIDAYKTWKIVEKQRSIYFIGNVKFHIDEVVGLGSFMEIEAIDEDGSLDSSTLERQCAKFVSLLHLDSNTFIDKSYSDMIQDKLTFD